MRDFSIKYYYRYDYFTRINEYLKIAKITTNDLLNSISSKHKYRYLYYNTPIIEKSLNNSMNDIEEYKSPASITKINNLNIDTTKDLSSNNEIIVPIIELQFNFTDDNTSIKDNNLDEDDITITPKNNSNSMVDLISLLLPKINDKKGTVSNTKRKLPIEWTDDELLYDFGIIDEKLETIEDLINLGKQYNQKYKSLKKRYNINLRVLSDLVEPLTELNSMIGMKNIKQSIFDKIILYLQGLDNKNTDFLHTVIYGAPGMGKTEVAKIIGKIYTKMGLLSKGDFKEVRLTDLKAGYVGQSELKTQKVFDDAKGCVLFMDEAYSLGSDDKLDQYSQSIVDVINPYLDKYKDDFIFIIAGYKDDLQNRFFRGNQGLRSRFGLWLEIDDYKGIDLLQIFKKKVKDYNWNVKDDDISCKFFDEHLKDFKYFGRDIENLFSKCKISHAKRVLYGKPEDKKIINNSDLEEGFKIYKKELDMENKDTQFEKIKQLWYM
jgi:SpoVK/Ycf46/Vps4 family AAA+-type ATPase